jgi:tetratricopeptide (TPR) repeat protein
VEVDLDIAADEVFTRTMDRVQAYRETRDHDQLLSPAAEEDLQWLLAAPRGVDPDLAVGWMCYCRYLSLGSAAAPPMWEVLDRFQPFLPRMQEHLPRSIVALMSINAEPGVSPGSPLQRAAQFLADVEPRIGMLPQSRTREPHDALLAELADVSAGLEAGAPQHNLALLYAAQVLRSRFEKFGDTADLTRAIDAARSAVERSQLDDLYVHTYANTLAGALCDRYEIGRDPADLHEAAVMSDLALRLTVAGHPDRGLLIGTHAAVRHLQEPAPEQVALWQAEKVDLLRESVRATPDGHEGYAEVCLSLVKALLDLYKHDNDTSTLGEAATCLDAVDRALDRHPSPEARARRAVLRGRVMFESSLLSGDPDTWRPIDREVSQAIAALGPTHFYLSAALHEHGLLLLHQYERCHEISILDRSIEVFAAAAGIVSPDGPDGAAIYNMWGFTLAKRADATLDRESARGLSAQALAAARTSMDHASAAVRSAAEVQSNFASVLRIAARVQGDDALRREAINILRRARDTAPTERGWRLASFNLASALSEAGAGLQDHADGPAGAAQRLSWLDEAIGLIKDVLGTIDPARSERAEFELGLARCLASRWRNTPMLDTSRGPYKDAAIALCEQLAHRADAAVMVRSSAMDTAGHVFADAGDWAAARRAFGAALDLLPAHVASMQVRGDQEFGVGEFTGLASNAAACALNLGDVIDAVRLLESGRGVLSGHPKPDVDAELAVLAQSLSGSEATVILNTSSLRSDALVITCTGIDTVPLPDLRQRDLVENLALIQYLSQGIGFAPERVQRDADALNDGTDGPRDVTSALAWLWESIVRPVLDSLGTAHGRAGGAAEPWTRVWWCPTGLLAFLPLHAAAADPPASGASTLDRVVSSYVPTLRALASMRAANREHRSAEPALLTVALPETPGLARLPGVGPESAAARAALPRGTSLESGNATRARILAEITHHDWLLFSGHATQNASFPGNGGLVPYDHLQSGLVTLEDIRGLGLQNAQVAVLSACETARGDLNVVDEVSHLAGALHSSGFTHVLAAQWVVHDTAAATIIAQFFDNMRHRGFQPEHTAFALHEALRTIRDLTPDPMFWAPLVHYGP